MKILYACGVSSPLSRITNDLIIFLLLSKNSKPNYVPTLEDEIESQRQKLVADLKKNGTTGTKITPETFAVWQAKKRKMKLEESRVSDVDDSSIVYTIYIRYILYATFNVDWSLTSLFLFFKKMVEKEMRKKKGGKGLAVLSGRALYEYKKELFNIESDPVSNEKSDDNVDKDDTIIEVAAKVESNLFLEGDDDSLDDLSDDE